jgi:hypothetical protein
MTQGKSIAIKNETHALVEALKLDLKIKSYDKLLVKLVTEYNEQRK